MDGQFQVVAVAHGRAVRTGGHSALPKLREVYLSLLRIHFHTPPNGLGQPPTALYHQG